MLRLTAAALALMLALPGQAALAQDKAPLTIRAKAIGPANTLMRVFWKASTAAANNYMRADKSSTVSIPGTIYVGTTLMRNRGETLHRWRFAGDFLERTGIKGGLSLPVVTDANDCLSPAGITELGNRIMERTSVAEFLSGIIVVGHVRAVCRTENKQVSVTAANKMIEDLYRALRRRVPAFDGGICAAGGDCRA